MKSKLDSVLELLWKRSRFTSYFYQSVHFIKEDAVPTLSLVVHASRLTLLYNEQFINDLDSDEILGLLVHEMMHVILSHEHRSGHHKHTYLLNLAQDMVVNSYIKDKKKTYFSKIDSYSAGVPQLILPKGLPLVPKDFFSDTSIKDPSWEDLYRWLREQPDEKVMKFSGSDSEGLDAAAGKGDSVHERLNEIFKNPLDMPEGMDEGMSEISLGDMKGMAFHNDDDSIVPTGVHFFQDRDQAQTREAKRNRILALAEKDWECSEERIFQDMKGIIEKVEDRDISSWQQMVKSIVDYSSQSSEWIYTYSRFNRRYFGSGIYSPGRIFKEQEVLTVAVDVSGSMVMKPGEIEAAFGVIEELLASYRVHLLCIDEHVFVPEKKGDAFVAAKNSDSPYIYKKGDWKYIRTGSSGTTFFAPLFNRYMKGHHEMLVVITDGYIYDLDQLKRYSPTLWIISGERPQLFHPPFGKIVEIGD